MKQNNILNKSIVLSLILFISSFLLFLILNFVDVPFYLSGIFISFILGLFLGLCKSKLNITLDNLKKIKISVYYSAIYIILFIPIGAFISYIGVEHHVVVLITALMFTALYMVNGVFLYLGLLSGDRLNLFKKKDF